VNEPTIIVHEANEDANVAYRLWNWPFLDRLNPGRIDLDSFGCDDVPKKLRLSSVKFTLAELHKELRLTETLENLSYVLLMLFLSF
jgi:hypothetical protein